jgi:Tol biopolymer transport system component
VASKIVDWSRTGWILFTPIQTLQAWKIKANGDSLTQLTFSSMVHRVETWSPDGRYFACYRSFGPAPQIGLAIYTARGAFVRVMPEVNIRAYEGIAWSPDGRRLAYLGAPNTPVAEPRLCLYDLTTNQLDTLDVLPLGYAGLSGVRWLPNGSEVVWGAANGIGITNVQTHQTRLVRVSCETGSRLLARPYPSPDGQQLLVSRTEYAVSPTDNNLLLERYSLETMNLRGTQIRKVTP